MKTFAAAALSVAIFDCSGALAEVAIRREPVRFAAGETVATLEGTIRGEETVDYVVSARAGQSMAVILESDNQSAYFNVTPPGSESAIFVGSTLGNRFEGTLPATGEFTVRLYLMRSAARRGERATYTIRFGISGEGAASATGGFDRTLELQGVRFHVSCPNDSSLPKLTIAPSGLALDNSTITREVDGRVVEAEVADLDANGSPEIYVYVQSVGSGSYGSLVALAANKRKSLSDIYLPPIADDPVASKGYMGHDEFRVVESTLVRRFPVYRDGDSNAKPTGGMRQIQYKLAAGEAGWLLRSDKVVEY